jgi:hypothetical protein
LAVYQCPREKSTIPFRGSFIGHFHRYINSPAFFTTSDYRAKKTYVLSGCNPAVECLLPNPQNEAKTLNTQPQVVINLPPYPYLAFIQSRQTEGISDSSTVYCRGVLFGALCELGIQRSLATDAHVFRRAFAVVGRELGLDALTIKDMGRLAYVDRAERCAKS